MAELQRDDRTMTSGQPVLYHTHHIEVVNRVVATGLRQTTILDGEYGKPSSIGNDGSRDHSFHEPK